MKKNNLWRIIWIVGIYAILVSILYLVIIYKVKWEDRDLNTYLYFYNCSNELCTSTYEIENHYSKIVCENDLCPFVKQKNNNFVVLNNGVDEWVYDFINNKIISDEYLEYDSLYNGNYIVKNSNELYGVIDSDNKILVNFNHDKIINYDNNFVVYSKDNKFGIYNEKSAVSIDPIYDDIILINDKLFAYSINNEYFIASYDSKESVSSIKYNYIYSIDNIIITFNENKLDILDTNLKSKLLMKIDTYYKYTTEKERGSLEFYKNGNFLYFYILVDDKNKIQYIYDLKNEKLIN